MYQKRAARPYAIWPAAMWFLQDAARAHSFYDRYDLPVPLHFFLWGAALVVALSFLLVAIFAKSPLIIRATESQVVSEFAIKNLAIRWITKALALMLFLLCIVAALFGTGNPLMNLAPSFIWVTWWVGFSLLVACVGNIWPALDPWRTLFECLGIKSDNRAWPKRLGMYPAVFLLLAWSWFEVVYPIAVVPRNLGYLALTWTLLSLLGMSLFGRETWQA